jgi:hypothetical protein
MEFDRLSSWYHISEFVGFLVAVFVSLVADLDGLELDFGLCKSAAIASGIIAKSDEHLPKDIYVYQLPNRRLA